MSTNEVRETQQDDAILAHVREAVVNHTNVGRTVFYKENDRLYH